MGKIEVGLTYLDAHAWQEEEEARLMRMGQTWGMGWPRGALMVPGGAILYIHRPLVFKARTGPVSLDPVLRDTNQFFVAENFPAAGKGAHPAMRWEDTRGGNGEFSNVIQNVSINCKGRSDGVVFYGDQESSIDGLRIASPAEIGLNCWQVTHGVEIRRLSIIGDVSAGGDGVKPGTPERKITGIRMRKCWGVRITAGCVHRAAVGVTMLDCDGVTVADLASEHVDVPGEIGERCTGCVASGVAKYTATEARNVAVPWRLDGQAPEL